MASNNRSIAIFLIGLVLFHVTSYPLANAQGIRSTLLGGGLLNGVVTPVVSGVGQAVSGVGQAVSGLGGVVSGASGTVNGVVTPTVSSVGQAVSGVGQAVSGLGGTVGGVVSGATGTVNGVVTPTVSGVGQAVSGVGQTVSGLGGTVGGVVSGATGAVSGVIGTVNGVVSGVGGIVTGALCCSSTGNCPGSPLSNVTVSLNCRTLLGSVVNIAQTTTNVTGGINFILSPVITLLLGVLGAPVGTITPCSVVVAVPLNSTTCSLLNGVNGVLNSTTAVVGSLVNTVTGTVTTVLQPVRFNLTLSA